MNTENQPSKRNWNLMGLKAAVFILALAPAGVSSLPLTGGGVATHLVGGADVLVSIGDVKSIEGINGKEGVEAGVGATPDGEMKLLKKVTKKVTLHLRGADKMSKKAESVGNVVEREKEAFVIKGVKDLAGTTKPEADAVTGPEVGSRFSLTSGNAAFPGVSLPEIPAEIELQLVGEEVGKFFTPAAALAPNLVGQAKSSASLFKDLEEIFTSTQDLGSQLPDPENYKFFGNGDHAMNLIYLLKTNPIMASALTAKMMHQQGPNERPAVFELRSFDPEDPDCKDDSCTLYQKLMGALDTHGNRVNFVFNSDMTEVERVRVYDDTTGNLIIDSPNEPEIVAHWASSANYSLFYYATCIHATLHVLHWLLTAALQFSSEAEGFDELGQWANTHAANVPAKYHGVANGLLRDQPDVMTILSGGDCDASQQAIADTYALLTGSAGFGADGAKLRPMLQGMLSMWTKKPSNFIEVMMNIPADKMMGAGILTEFMKHNSLVSPFASEVTAALRGIDSDKYAKVENRTAEFLQLSGIDSNIETIEQWIELVSVTGIVHGCTLSYSRIISDPEVLKWRDIKSSVWAASDINILDGLLAAAAGIIEDRHVFSPSTDNGAEYAAALQNVLVKYNDLASELKEDYKNEIMKDPEEFNNFGWILSDFCPDGFDGKQLTIATYM